MSAARPRRRASRPPRTKLAPGFLVASPSLVDPNFARTVVLLVEHGESGSLGFIVNRPADLAFEKVREALGLAEGETAHVPFPLFVGGPVSPQSGWILFDPREASETDLSDAVVLADRLALSASRALLERMARPTSFEGARLLAMGYAGWSGGQLDEELERGVWLPATLRADLVFEVTPEERWAAVLRAEGIDPGRIVARIQPGGANNVS